jgi:tetratricopeptide (TPR) repeat protein
MKLSDIYRLRESGSPREALKAAELRLEDLAREQSDETWWEMWRHLMCLKGDCYLDLESFQEAEACFDEVYDKTKNPVGLANRAYSRWAMGQLDKAKVDYLEAVALPQDDKEREVCFRKLAEISIVLREFDEAKAFVKKAKDIAGNCSAIRKVENELRQQSGRK